MAPESRGGLTFFMGDTALPTAVDNPAQSVRAAFGAEVYDMVVVSPEGTVPALRRDWVLPADEAELEAIVRDLLGAGPGPTPDAGVNDAGVPDAGSAPEAGL